MFDVISSYETSFTILITNQKKLFIYLNFRIVFRGSKTKLFQEHLVFLISDDIKKGHLRRCQLSEREKEDCLGLRKSQPLEIKAERTSQWQTLTGLHESIHYLEESVINFFYSELSNSLLFYLSYLF